MKRLVGKKVDLMNGSQVQEVITISEANLVSGGTDFELLGATEDGIRYRTYAIYVRSPESSTANYWTRSFQRVSDREFQRGPNYGWKDINQFK